MNSGDDTKSGASATTSLVPADGGRPEDAPRYDAIIIGAGQAGPGVARYLASEGQRVALVEADKIGGTCLNRGCRPTKALRASARVAHVTRNAARHGISAGEITVDFAATMARKDRLIDGWFAAQTDSLEHIDGLTLMSGEAHFVGRAESGFVVQVADRSISATDVYLNVGTRTTKPSIPGLDDVAWLDNDRILHLDTLPSHLVILGGSYIGLELGQIFSRFGTEVTIVERGERVAAREEDQISAEITRFLSAEGIQLHTSTTVARIDAIDDGVRVHIDDAAPIDGSHLLVAVGRTPNTDRLDLDRIGLTTDDHGFIPTDGVFRTAIDGIWALGDINARGAFTHTSYQDYEILVDHLRGGHRSADGRIPTYAMFTDPPLGRVGMTEREARASGRQVAKATMAMSEVTRAALDGERDGLITLLVDTDTDRFLGASVLGLAGDEIVQIISALMHADAPYQVLVDMLPIHPTVAEFFPTILGRLAPLVPLRPGQS